MISGNDSVGVRIQGPGATGTFIQNNIIGLNATGTKALPNTADGVFLNSAAGNLVGGLVTGQGNVISGNGGSGVQIFGTSSVNNVVVGNLIGTDSSGEKPIGNAAAGIFVNAGSNNLIGFITAGGRNVVAANHASGIVLAAGATNNAVNGNYVGLNATGEKALGNLQGGVFIAEAPRNLIGGTVAGAGNVISGNKLAGIQIFDAPSTANLVQGNIIGLNASGLHALGNAADGVLVNDAPGNAIGGPIAVAGNYIAANGGFGIQIFGAGSTGNFVSSNVIGRSFAGVAIPNAFGTVLLNASPNNTVSVASVSVRASSIRVRPASHHLPRLQPRAVDSALAGLARKKK